MWRSNMESWESYHGHSDPAGVYSHGGIRYSYTAVSAPRGHESSDDSDGVDEHQGDLDDPDYDGEPGSPPSDARDNEVKFIFSNTNSWVFTCTAIIILF